MDFIAIEKLDNSTYISQMIIDYDTLYRRLSKIPFNKMPENANCVKIPLYIEMMCDYENHYRYFTEPDEIELVCVPENSKIVSGKGYEIDTYSYSENLTLI